MSKKFRSRELFDDDSYDDKYDGYTSSHELIDTINSKWDSYLDSEITSLELINYYDRILNDREDRRSLDLDTINKMKSRIRKIKSNHDCFSDNI
jgi:hypothetical protein